MLLSLKSRYSICSNPTKIYNHLNRIILYKLKNKIGKNRGKQILYRRIPGNKDELSILGFGCMRLGVKDGKLDEEKTKEQILYSIDNGLNYIDTAWTYHFEENEAFIGQVLSNGYREKVKLATKLSSWSIESRKDMDKILRPNLRGSGQTT